MSRKQSVLISGASIAGPSLALWLDRYGFEVTVVERAATVRPGGYPIDIRGTAMEAARRMGIAEDLWAAHIDTRRILFFDGAGEMFGTIRPEASSGGVEGRDTEVPRGVLTEILYERTRDHVEYIFDDSIDSLDNQPDGVDVTLQSGRTGTFDFVVGADGLHSNVRRLVFGDESQFERNLGWYFAGFQATNALHLSHEALLYNTVGCQGSQYAVGDDPPTVHAFLSFHCPDPPPLERRDLEGQRRLFQDRFADHGWDIPRLLKELQEDDNAFFDTVSQIDLPNWSRGRVSLVGDASYAASFLSGQGTSLALVGAYVLAGELATARDHRAAFANYERLLRPFAKAQQAIALRNRAVLTETPRQLAVRNFAIRRIAPLLVALRLAPLMGRRNRRATTALTLPNYAPSIAAS